MGRWIPSSADGLVLLDRDEAVLESLALHLMLSFDQIRRLHFSNRSEKPARRALGRLVATGLACALTGTALGRRKIWCATPRGRAAVGAQRSAAVPHVAGRSRVAHTLAVNEFCIALAEAARTRGDRFTHLHWRNEIEHRAPGGLVIPDAVATYELADGAQAFRFLELDTGTMPLPRVQEKLLRYAALRRTDGWRRDYLAFPKVAVILGGRYQAQRLGRLLRAASVIKAGTPRLEVLLACADDVDREGPLASVWGWAGEEGRRGFLR